MLVEDASTAVPLLHSSGMYLRWDPTDSATAEQGKRAWAELLENHAKLPVMDPATGTSRRTWFTVSVLGFAPRSPSCWKHRCESGCALGLTPFG